jgi:hypothetical protein
MIFGGMFDIYILLLEKVMAVVGTVVYAIFALVIVKQVMSMSKYVVDKFNNILIAFSFIHLFFALILIVVALILL